MTPPHAPRVLAAFLVTFALTGLAAREVAAAPVIEGKARVSATTSPGIAYGILGVGLGLVVLLLADATAREKKHAAAARASVSEDPPLKPGRVVLAGVVAAEDDAPPVRITITQQGREWRTKGGWAHRWRETSRDIEVRPFRLVLPGGASIPVEPGDDVFLVDKLDRTAFFEGLKRTRTAELSPGERAVVSGVLRRRAGAQRTETAYRGGGSELVLTAPPGGKLLVSTEPLEQRHLDRAGFHRGWALLFAAFLAACQLLCLTYTRRLAFGQVMHGVVTGHRHYTTRSKNSTTHHYEITARVEDADGSAHQVTEDVDPANYDAVSKGDALAVLAVPASSPLGFDGQLGDHAGLHVDVVTITMIGLLGMTIVYFVQRASSRPWYEREKLVDEGTGRIVRA